MDGQKDIQTPDKACPPRAKVMLIYWWKRTCKKWKDQEYSASLLFYSF